MYHGNKKVSKSKVTHITTQHYFYNPLRTDKATRFKNCLFSINLEIEILPPNELFCDSIYIKIQ